MRKFVILLSTMVFCAGLSACENIEYDPTAIQDATETIKNVTSSINEMETYVEDIQESVQAGIDSTNAAMEWYKTEAWADNPWISTPITEDEVEDIIEMGQKEVNSYIGDNAVYGVLTDRDIDYFTDYFADESANGFLLSTYEKPSACNANEVFARYDGIIEELNSSEKERKGASDIEGKISEKDINEVLLDKLGITNDELDNPLKLSKGSDVKYLYLDETMDCKKLVCNGGFYYNNVYLVMMRDKYDDAPFSLTALTKEDDGSVKIQMNYWSEDMKEVDWDGSFLYDLYGMMQDSDLKNIISIPGMEGELSLGSMVDAASGLAGVDIEDAAELVSDAKDKAKTYMQEFDGYEVYYSNVDPEKVGEYVVSQIDVTGGDFKTAEGIGIGSTIDDLKDKYGDGVITRLSKGREQIMYERGRYNMLFILGSDGSVEEMTMFLADAVNGD